MHCLPLALSLLAGAQAYLILTEDPVNCRLGPQLGYPVVTTYANGTDVCLECQTRGSAVFGDTVWGKTSDGCFVSNYYTATGSKEFVVEACPADEGGNEDVPPIPQPNTCEPCVGPNAAGIKLIKDWEGFIPVVYPDPIGLPTVGYGHLCRTPNCSEVAYPFPLSLGNGSRLLYDDIPEYSSCLAAALDPAKVKLNDNQWAALVSFTYNLGCRQTSEADFITMINNGTDPNTAISTEFPLWIYAGGQILDGLKRRRAAEVELALTPSNGTAFPYCK